MAKHDQETRAYPRPAAFPEAPPIPCYLRPSRSPDGKLLGRRWRLQGEVRVGRDAGNEIAIEDPDISRWHAVLLPELQGYRIRDLGSKNGTIVNGCRTTGDFLLHPGDLILVGSTVLAFERG